MRITRFGLGALCLLLSGTVNASPAPKTADEAIQLQMEAVGERWPERWQGRQHYLFDEQAPAVGATDVTRIRARPAGGASPVTCPITNGDLYEVRTSPSTLISVRSGRRTASRRYRPPRRTSTWASLGVIVTVWPALMPAPTGTQASPFPRVDPVPAETAQVPGRTAASRSARSSSAVRRRP